MKDDYYDWQRYTCDPEQWSYSVVTTSSVLIETLREFICRQGDGSRRAKADKALRVCVCVWCKPSSAGIRIKNDDRPVPLCQAEENTGPSVLHTEREVRMGLESWQQSSSSSASGHITCRRRPSGCQTRPKNAQKNSDMLVLKNRGREASWTQR